MSSGRLRITILGCGSSGGVPRIGNHWGACDPENPKNRRRRCSIMVERVASNGSITRVLVDTSPDMREQLLDAGVGTLDAVIFTHDHADQTHGLDDLRMVAINMCQRIAVYGDEATLTSLRNRFGYCFETPPGSSYPPILDARTIRGSYEAFSVTGEGGALHIQPFHQHHGDVHALGFRFGPVAYSSDAAGLPEESFAILEGVGCWIVDALRYREHPTHANVETALSWIARVKPAHAVLTNLHVDLDYETLKGELPAGVEPAYDGMVLEFDV